MSRIFGLFGKAIRDSDWHRLVAASSREGWEVQRLDVDGARLGWTGHGSSSSFTRSGVTVVADALLMGTSRSAAESIHARYLESGTEGLLDSLEGDFAFAIFDEVRKHGWLGRDRLGVRPLYYATLEDGVAFSSQPRPLLSLADVSKRLDPSYVARVAGSHYRYFDNYPDRSPFVDVSQLPAAHSLGWSNDGPRVRRYWTLEPLDLRGVPAEELAARYRELLLTCVGERLALVDRPSFTLSGGMDSSTVLACAVAVSGQKQIAVSSVYDDATFDESDDIVPMAAVHAQEWMRVPVGIPDVLSMVTEMIELHDEPVATATWLSHLLVTRAVAERGSDSLFGGLGGDELNAGEYEYFPFHFADLAVSGRSADLATEVDAWVTNHDHPIYRKTPAVANNAMARLTDRSQPGRCLPDLDRMLRYQSLLQPEYAAELERFEPRMEEPFDSYLLNRTYQDLFFETAPCCLRAEDRNSTAAGLVHVDPFMDRRLAEFMFGVPGGLKIHDGVTKRLLRDATQGLLPEETRTRIKKTGWNAPAHLWFTGDSASGVRELVRSPSFVTRGIYDAPKVEKLLDEHERIIDRGEQRDNHMMFFWQLVNLELWLQAVDRW